MLIVIKHNYTYKVQHYIALLPLPFTSSSERIKGCFVIVIVKFYQTRVKADEKEKKTTYPGRIQTQTTVG